MKFKTGQFVELIDTKGRKYIFQLKKNEKFHFHQGFVLHNEIIGKEPGCQLVSSKGKKVLVFYPKTSDFLLKMKRGAQIIYPKDLGAILTLGDISLNNKVLEAGTGSGALTIYLLKMVGEKGKVISYERRKEFLERAKENIKNYFGKLPQNLILRKRDIYKQGIRKEDKNLDRVVLDLPEPWRAIDAVKKSLKAGGILMVYNPTVQQMLKVKKEIDKTKRFYFEGMYEVLQREWKIEEMSMRPKDRMVAHTGFILVARRLS